MSSHRASRALLVTLVGVSVLLAGCLGGRRGAPRTDPPAEVADSIARADSAAADSLPLDSAARAARDSAAADSAARAVSALDSAALDSLAQRDTTDTLTRGDTALTKTVPVKRTTARECVLDFSENHPDARLISSLMNDGSRTTYIGGGVVARCQGDPQVVSADSAEQLESSGILNLVGNVVFLDPGKIRMTARAASYFTGEEKMVAYENVVVTDLPTGSTFSGPIMEYYRAGERRPFSRLYAPQRPTMRLIERDSAGNEQPPVSITANQFEAFGDTGVVGWGNVVINRSDITGEGDSASFDKRTERARLIRNAFIMSRDTTQSFRLVGDSIDLFSTDRVLERVVALHRAQATSNDVNMRAERVEMHLDSQQVDRAWAFGPGRAYAETPLQLLEADSIEILMPKQLLQRVNAIGNALAFGTPDTLRIREPEQDVLSGDTIVAEFDTVTTAPDTAPKSYIQQVTAILRASAKYQLPSNRGRNCPPAINYVRGQKVVVLFDSGTVQTVSVDSQASGVYLEPLIDVAADTGGVTCATASDSTRADSARADSMRADSVSRPDSIPPIIPPVIPPTGVVFRMEPATRPTRKLALSDPVTPRPFKDPWKPLPAAAVLAFSNRLLHDD